MATAAISDRAQSLADLNVHACFESHKKGNPEEYRKLVTQLEKSREDPPSTLLSALAQSTEDIDEHLHGDLLRVIFNLSPWTCQEETVTCVGDLLLSLVSSNSRLLHSCLDWLVFNFLPPAFRLSANEVAKELQWSRRESILARIHLVLERLTDMVPTAPIHLLPILLRRMPHRRVDEKLLLLYLDNLFRLATQKRMGAAVGNQLLVAIIDYLIQIDVEISWEDILRLEELRQVEDASRDQTTTTLTEEKEVQGRWAERNTSDQMVGKLDSLMDATLSHIQQRIKCGQLEEVHEVLMTSFRTTIVHASRSKFTQFLIFYTCSYDNVKCGGSFLSYAMSVLMSTSEPPKTRVSAAAYLASFCARAKFLKLNSICIVLQSLTKWLMAHLCDWDVEVLTRPGDDHMVFHAGLQAVLYMLCYRMLLMDTDPYARSVLRSLPLQQLLERSSLRVLLSSVFEEFLFQAAELRLLSKNAVDGIRRHSKAAPSSDSVSVCELDMFFPFDPYLLKTSARFIAELYIDWSDVQAACLSHKAAADDDEDDDDDVISDDGADADSERESLQDCSPNLESMTLSDNDNDNDSAAPDMDSTLLLNLDHVGKDHNEEELVLGTSWQLEEEAVAVTTLDDTEFNRMTHISFDFSNLSTTGSQPLLSLPAFLPSS